MVIGLGRSHKRQRSVDLFVVFCFPYGIGSHRIVFSSGGT